MTQDQAATPAVDILVDSMMQSHGQLALILDHMQRRAARNPCAASEPIPDILRRLLCDVLAPLSERHGLDDVATAAQMLAAATDLVGEDLYLVD
jgi:hypothetical protein